MVCRHGVVYRMANLFKGESYRVILWMLLYAQLNNFMFFCYDVICKFWPFVKKAATKGKENKLGALSRFIGGLPGRVRPFLSRFHGQTHSWPCQVCTITVKTSIFCKIDSIFEGDMVWTLEKRCSGFCRQRTRAAICKSVKVHQWHQTNDRC